MKRLAIISVFIGAFIGWSGSSPAYKFQYTPTKKPVRWFKRDISYRINSSALNIPAEVVREEIKKSFLTWELALGSKLRFHFQGYTRSRATGMTGANSDNLLIWENSVWPGAPNAAAVTLVTYRTDTGEILDADISFNAINFRWVVAEKCAKNSGCPSENLFKSPSSRNGKKIPVDIRTIAIHEIGHFLGLGHSENPSAMMFPSQQSIEKSRRSLHSDDIAGIRKLYSLPIPSPSEGDGVSGRSGSGLSSSAEGGLPSEPSGSVGASPLQLSPPPPFGFGCSISSDFDENGAFWIYTILLLTLFLILFKNR